MDLSKTAITTSVFDELFTQWKRQKSILIKHRSSQEGFLYVSALTANKYQLSQYLLS